MDYYVCILHPSTYCCLLPCLRSVEEMIFLSKVLKMYGYFTVNTFVYIFSLYPLPYFEIYPLRVQLMNINDSVSIY